jgi:hypothetical protein
VAADCYGVAHSVRVLRLPGLDEHGDRSDWADNGGSREMLLELIAGAPLWQPELAGDELTEMALQQAQQCVASASEMIAADEDVPMSADERTDHALRRTGREAARVIDMIMLILTALGFEGNHYRLINALIASAKKLPNPFVFFVASHTQIYQKYRRAKTIKDSSKTALVGTEMAKLRAEQEALGLKVVDYIPGKMHLDSGQAYASRYRLQILRYSLIAVDLANKVRGEFKHRWQADEWAADQVAGMIPRSEPAGTVKVNRLQAKVRPEKRTFEDVKREFFGALSAELNRVIRGQIAVASTPLAMGESVDELVASLTNKINRMASESLCRGLAELAESERETLAAAARSYVHETMDIGVSPDNRQMGLYEDRGMGGSEPITRNASQGTYVSTYQLRKEDMITSMPDDELDLRAEKPSVEKGTL